MRRERLVGCSCVDLPFPLLENRRGGLIVPLSCWTGVCGDAGDEVLLTDPLIHRRRHVQGVVVPDVRRLPLPPPRK